MMFEDSSLRLQHQERSQPLTSVSFRRIRLDKMSFSCSWLLSSSSSLILSASLPLHHSPKCIVQT